MQRAPTHLARHRHLKESKQPHKKYTHMNLFLMGIGVVATYYLSQSDWFISLVLHLGNYRYLASIIAGILFVTTFTATTGALMLTILINLVPWWELVLLAGAGAVIADMTILNMVKNDVLEEIEDILNEFHGKKLIHIFNTKAFRWTLPVIGAIIIASPLPDELGVGLMGISKIKPHHFAFLSYLLNTVGILITVTVVPWLRG